MDLRPYILPDGNVQIAFSGGRTSAYMLWHILQACGGLIPRRVVVIFLNTGLEMAQTLDFIRECGERWAVEIVWLEFAPSRDMTKKEIALVEKWFGKEYAVRFAAWWRRSKNSYGFNRVSHSNCARGGEPFLALILLRKYLPNQNGRFCTIELKVRTAKRYLMSLGWLEWINCVGLRADEPRRIKQEGVKFKDRWTVWQPLNHAGVTKQTIADFWGQQSFDLRLPNVNGNCWLGNCHGCFLKSEANIAALHRDFPDLSKWWECAENLTQSLWAELSPWQRLRRIVSSDGEITEKLREAYGRPIPPSVISSMVDKPRSAGQFSKRYSRKELHRFVDSQGDWIFNTEDALCQADAGECMG